MLFGDSLSDNGNGYAGNAKFVLRTNQVMSLRWHLHIYVDGVGESRTTSIRLNEGGNVRRSESELRFNADIPRKPLL